MKLNSKSDFIKGFWAGIPVVLGYFFVSVGVGVYASGNGISPLEASIMSLSNLTSAGEISAIEVFGRAGGYLELFLGQVTINARYALMGISLSQKTFSKSFSLLKKIPFSFGITDEIFAILYNKKDAISPSFTLFLILCPIFSWTAGTYIGATIGSIVSPNISSCLSILIYAMLIAIIIPEAREKKPILLTVLSAAFFSCIIYYFLPFIKPGYSIIISSVTSALVSSLIFPVRIPEKDIRLEQKEGEV